MGHRTIGFAMIGCGVVADYHIGAVQESDGAELVGVYSRSETRARTTGEAHGVPWFTDHEAILRRPEVDVVCICTPSGVRIPIVTDAAEAGKHLIVEKPLDVSIRNMDRIIRAAGDAGVKLMGVFQLRYGQAVNRVRNAVQAGALGRMVLADAYIKWFRPQDYYDADDWRGNWAMEGGGALMTQGSHTVDLLQWIMGPVKRVYARMGTLIHDIEVEDTVVATLEYENGALGVIEASSAAYPGLPARMEFSGDRGTIVVEADQISKWDVEGEGVEETAADTTDVARAASDSKTFGTEGHKAQVTEMVRILNEGGEPAIDGPESKRAIEIILAIYESARSGDPVALPFSG
ncbi:MAG: Gfo/Idh/MocA family oxidoreductase [Gemmatimonadetes bacterium]|nr:Gfo/Idh/MocA family oxidoreductase [Gemmatimonadota bacterium]MDE3260055.1 Gfo/Idh/MocA family oxidoreductase [Gemmatimonadota bacterium]